MATNHHFFSILPLTLGLLFVLAIVAPAAVYSARPGAKDDPTGKSGGAGFFGPGSGGFDIPSFGFPPDFGGAVGGGYGGGYSGPGGGYSRNGVFRPTVVCKEKGPCYKKKLACPAKCFTSYSSSGKNFGGGGGGGGCTMDCKKKCIAYC